ncbi:hypothetical protein INT43_000612 [Umbelopsis isabellina]|uniref:Uncharacterized protein n=1 Tax=Mortierella isabellina TaxID=91625 RepID=A0A8H7Q441_MORIS|nr:hypothetical protein INT43_000612 [Umbelopsis isabellina]
MPYFSITNYTQVPLHIALSHLGPVHYYNNLKPNQTVTLSVGKVWFTIEAKVASGENEYKWHHVAVPIVAATVVGVASAAALGVMATAATADAALATLFTAGARAGTYALTLQGNKPVQFAAKKLKVVGSDHIKDFKKSWVSKKCCQRYGVFIPKEGIEARIVGGPQGVYTTDDGVEVVDADVWVHDFHIVLPSQPEGATAPPGIGQRATPPLLPPRPSSAMKSTGGSEQLLPEKRPGFKSYQSDQTVKSI